MRRVAWRLAPFLPALAPTFQSFHSSVRVEQWQGDFAQALFHNQVQDVARVVKEHPESVTYRLSLPKSQTGTGEEFEGTALHVAAFSKAVDAVRFLTDMGADAAAINSKSLTPLHCAAASGSAEAAEHLVHNGGALALNQQDKILRGPLHLACFYGHLQCAQFLERAGASLSLRDALGNTPLLAASMRGHETIVRWLLCLLDSEAASTANTHGLSALHMAAILGKDGVVSALLDHGVQMETRSKNDWTPLMCAALYGRLGATQLLTSAGADWCVVDGQGLSPLHLAAREGHKDTATFLAQLGTPPMLSGVPTPRELAVKRGHTALADLL